MTDQSRDWPDQKIKKVQKRDLSHKRLGTTALDHWPYQGTIANDVTQARVRGLTLLWHYVRICK